MNDKNERCVRILRREKDVSERSRIRKVVKDYDKKNPLAYLVMRIYAKNMIEVNKWYG